MPLFSTTGVATHTGVDFIVARFGKVRAEAGLRAALSYLGALTGYRFVSVVRMSADKPVAVAHFDRDHRDELVPKAWPRAVLGACLARDGTGRLCEVKNKRPRPAVLARAHPDSTPSAQQQLHYDCQAVPVMDEAGRLLASLCLYDLRSRAVPEAELSLLLRVASSLAQQPSALRRSLVPLGRKPPTEASPAAEMDTAPGMGRAGAAPITVGRAR